jgi:predicted RNase H-like HicB family nuclease
MNHYVAIVEDEGPQTAIGLWFPDLPGCFSAGDTIDEAMANAPDAIAAYAESLAAEGRALPRPRSLAELRNDARFIDELGSNMVALVAAPPTAAAAE